MDNRSAKTLNDFKRLLLYYSYFGVDILVFAVLYFVLVYVPLLVWVSPRLHGLTL